MKRILCGFLVALVIVCALLVAADLINITQYIPLTQNYDWLAFIGAIIGGIATFSGVYFTLDYQKKSDEEKKRNDNAPIIKIDVSYKSLEEHHGGIFTLNGSEVYTSGFPKDYKKNYPIIELRLANDKPAFDVCIDSCATREHTLHVSYIGSVEFAYIQTCKFFTFVEHKRQTRCFGCVKILYSFYVHQVSTFRKPDGTCRWPGIGK